MIAASKFVRRKIGFETDTSALSLVPGDLIAVQQRLAGTAWGFGGRVRANSALRGSSNTHTVQNFQCIFRAFYCSGYYFRRILRLILFQ